MNLSIRSPRLSALGFSLAFAALLGLTLLATSTVAHPSHAGSESTPWYRYLPPGTPIPQIPAPK